MAGRVCLYTEDDMSALFRAAGFAAEKIFVRVRQREGGFQQTGMIPMERYDAC